METIEQIIESTPEYKSRSPKKPDADLSQLTGKLKTLACMNREGTTKLYNPIQLYDKFNEYAKVTQGNTIKSNQLLTGGMNAGQVVTVDKPRMFMIQDFCHYIGVNSKYLVHVENSIKGREDEESQLYSNVIQYIRECISVSNIQNAAANELNALIVSRVEQLNEKVEHSGTIDQTVTQITFIQKNVEDIQFIEVQPDQIDQL